MSLIAVVYHVISKVRGNEKNPMMNTYGITLALMMLFSYAGFFAFRASRLFIYARFVRWQSKHHILYEWVYSLCNSTYLLVHWLFNGRYLKSTFRLPLLKKKAEFYCDDLAREVTNREE